MQNIVFAFVIAIICSTQTASSAAAQILVLNDTEAPPLTNDDKTGFFDIIVGEAFKRCGLELQLVKLPAERGLKNANAGIEDGEISRISGMEEFYPNLVPVPEKIFDMNFVAFAHKPGATTAEIKIDDWQSLKPYIVGFIKGWKIFERNVPAGTNIVYAHDTEQLFTLLEKRRIDIALYSRLVGLNIVHRRQMDGVTSLLPPLATRELFTYLHNSHEDVVPCIAEALAALKNEGLYEAEYKKIEARFSGVN